MNPVFEGECFLHSISHHDPSKTVQFNCKNTKSNNRYTDRIEYQKILSVLQ